MGPRFCGDDGEGLRGDVLFVAIDDTDWYDRWAASGFIIQPPTPLFPRLEMPQQAA